MKIKPVKIMVNLPIVLPFGSFYEIPQFAAAINSIINGKVKVKCEELGTLGPQCMGLFYLKHDDEYQQLRREFLSMIDDELQKEHSND